MSPRAEAPKAIVIAGGAGTAHCPLANVYPSMLFPIADGRPLVEHLLEFLQAHGINSVGFSLSVDSFQRQAWERALDHALHPGLEIVMHFDRGNRGPAGALRDFRAFAGRAPLIVLPSHLWLEGLDLDACWNVHQASGAVATVLLEAGDADRGELESISVGRDGAIEAFSTLHESRDHRQRLRTLGVYLFEPGVLDLVDSDGYFDLREQLLVKMQERRMRVQAHILKRPPLRMDNISNYLALNRSLLLEDFFEACAAGDVAPDGRNSAIGVHISPTARIHDTALIIGPVTIGNECEIGANVRIIGPVVLCAGSRVEAGALLRDSTVWPRSTIGRCARVEFALVTHDCTVAPHMCVVNAVVDQGRIANDRLNQTAYPELPVLDPGARGHPGTGDLRRARRAAYRVAKRAMDVLIPLAALPVLLPLAGLIALAIKFDSPGPVFFWQRRCGKGGSEFDICKFRTMVSDAARIHAQLEAHNGTDGPMFKMHNDPRITRIGRLLRRTSLDELPQLWCVLIGEMSLVGPRPLAMKEMKWAPRWRDIRLRVKPGLTGLWQINGRSSTGFDGWVEYDIRYVRTQSLLLDLYILLRTFGAVVRGSGAV